ncbi:MAG: aminopeptidase P family protein [Candidatus Krumholzibacteriia bacterium]
MDTRQKLAALRALMRANKVDAFYVPSTDPHQSEYVPAMWQRRPWLTGFTGSAGDVVVTARQAALWTDSRYFLQAELQLRGSGIALMKLAEPGTPSVTGWIARQLKPGHVLGVDPQLLSVQEAESFVAELAEAGVAVRPLAANLVDEIWTDRPEPRLDPVRLHSARHAGETARDKLRQVRTAMRAAGARAHVLAALDTIAWLFNVRGADVDFNPVVIAYAVVLEKEARLFIDPRKITPELTKALKRDVKLLPYAKLPATLRELRAARLPVLLDPATTNAWVADQLRADQIVRGPSPVTALKAVKNRVQIRGVEACHVRDGVAMVKFLKWLEPAVRAGGVTELSAADRLEAFRAEGRLFQGLSFNTISAYGPHGAIVHYAADRRSNARLRPRGIYLIDSGGLYLDGTTDITRTVTLGGPTPRQKEAFTRVLRGHIAVAAAKFPAGTSGQRLEVLARAPLWEAGLNYGHGTGHGVGHYLSVHEGPMGLTPKDVRNVPLRPGNLLSIEPGYYRAGAWGIRLENLAFVAQDEKLSGPAGDWYRWDVVTLCPLDRRLVDRRLLTPRERAWLNAYHARVYRELRPHLDPEHRAWLKSATRPI